MMASDRDTARISLVMSAESRHISFLPVLTESLEPGVARQLSF